MEIHIDKTDNTPIYQQIYQHVRSGILEGHIIPGTKLPSIRKLAESLDVACNTVDSAYRQLCVEGYVSSRRGAGYTVCDIALDELKNIDSPQETLSTELLLDPIKERYTYDFQYGDLCDNVFPVDAWRRMSASVLSEESNMRLSSYGGKRGDRALRVQIAAHLERLRGVVCKPEQIIITSGTQQSIALVLGLFDAACDHVAMDDPGYYPAQSIFRNAGFTLESLRSDAGPDVYMECVDKSNARLFYTTPSHQFPFGWCMDQNTRAQMLAQAVRKDAYILEDDYDSAYRYNSQPVPSLHSMDQWERVIYLGTFSKILSPALRMSYVVLPPVLLQRYEQGYRGTRTTVCSIEQMVMRRFLEQGCMEKHLRRTVLAYRKRYQVLASLMREEFDERVKIYDGEAGLFVLLAVNNGLDQEDLVVAAAKEDVRVYPTRQLWLNPAEAPDNIILLGFSAASVQVIRTGIPLLRRAWFPDARR